jgi:hypothetical protein
MKKSRNISNQIIKKSTGVVTLAALAAFLLFSATVLPDQSAKAAVYSGDAGSPDLSLFYAPDDLTRMAEQFGPAGRQSYVRARFTFDLAFPILYGAFLLSAIAWSLGRLTSDGSSWRLLVYIPLLAVFFDLLENTAASLVIGRFPQPSPLAASLAPYFTLIKWIFVGCAFALALLLPVLYLVRRLKK